MKLTRRRLWQLGVPSALAAMGGLGYSTLLEPQRMVVERVPIRLSNLPLALEGFRIAVLTDFHLYPFTKLPHIQRAVTLANDLQPDVAVLLGDFVDANVEAILELAPALSGLRAQHGIFAVLGNHDHWKGAKIVRAALVNEGIQVLRNAGVPLTVAGHELYLAGLESAWCGRPDIAQALSERRGDSPVVLLVHEPDYADKAAQDPRISLQLSGHSHGGQVRLPLIGALELPSWGRKYDCGHYHVGAMQLYTNRGIGLVDLPVRFNCPPEVTEITLSRA